MNPVRNTWVRKVGGWFLLILGVAGCLLPVLPGIPFAIAGLIVLARDYSWAKAALRKAKRHVATMRRRARGKRSGQPVTTPE